MLEESHVACLSLERLCLSALGLENTQPSQRYQPLLEFEIAQYANLGRGALYMMRGRGYAARHVAAPAPLTTRDLIIRTLSSGQCPRPWPKCSPFTM